MRYDFHRLKPVTCYDAITLRIPERWNVSEDNGDTWGYYQEEDNETDGADTDTGTLWITLDNYYLGGTNGNSAADLARESIEQIAGHIRQRGQIVDEKPIQPVDDGYLWYHTDEAEENGEPLAFFRYQFHLAEGRDLKMVNFSFVLTRAQLDDPEFRQLIATMDREIRAARLDVFKDRQREIAEEAFGPLHLCNFADQVKLMLPESIAMEASDAGMPDSDYRWSGRFKTERSHASLFVITRDRRVRGAEVGGVILRGDDGDIALEPVFPGADSADSDAILPWSRVLYEITDDRKPGEEIRLDTGPDADHPLQHHIWRHLYYAAGTGRELLLILMVPLAAKDEPRYLELIAYLDREVRRAIFPGLTPEQPDMKEITT